MRRYLNHKGLSLVEVVTSALITTLILSVLFTVYIAATNMCTLALDKAVALAWAESAIELRKIGDPAGLPPDPAADNIISNEKAGQINVGLTDYHAYERITATVTWTE